MKSTLKYAAATAAIALLCATSGRVYANATIEMTATDSNYVALANGQMLPSGDLIELGQFSISDSAVSALASGNSLSQANYATLLSDFIPLANGISQGTAGSATVAGSAGAYDISFTGNNAGFANGGAYLLVFNAATSGAANQVGVFKNGTFPGDMTAGTKANDLDTGTILLGSYTAATSVDNAWNDDVVGNPVINTFNLDTVVPEPSTYMLVGSGLIGLLAMRRRRSA